MDYQLLLEMKNNLKRLLNLLGDKYCYVKWVPQMAERETALVVWAKKKVSRSTGSVGCAENQRKDKIRTVEFREFFM